MCRTPWNDLEAIPGDLILLVGLMANYAAFIEGIE
jgi:hypothetical protein